MVSVHLDQGLLWSPGCLLDGSGCLLGASGRLLLALGAAWVPPGVLAIGPVFICRLPGFPACSLQSLFFCHCLGARRDYEHCCSLRSSIQVLHGDAKSTKHFRYKVVPQLQERRDTEASAASMSASYNIYKYSYIMFCCILSLRLLVTHAPSGACLVVCVCSHCLHWFHWLHMCSWKPEGAQGGPLGV